MGKINTNNPRAESKIENIKNLRVIHLIGLLTLLYLIIFQKWGHDYCPPITILFFSVTRYMIIERSINFLEKYPKLSQKVAPFILGSNYFRGISIIIKKDSNKLIKEFKFDKIISIVTFILSIILFIVM